MPTNTASLFPSNGVSFVAFVDADETGDSRSVVPEGLWIACDGSSIARSALVDSFEAGWDRVVEGVSLNELWRIAQFPDGERTSNLDPLFVEGEAAIFDLQLVTGERFRLALPVDAVSELTVVEGPDTESVLLVGDHVSASINFGTCINDGYEMNRRGSTVREADGSALLCRPDDRLSMRVTPSPDAIDDLDLRPIVYSRGIRSP